MLCISLTLWACQDYNCTCIPSSSLSVRPGTCRKSSLWAKVRPKMQFFGSDFPWMWRRRCNYRRPGKTRYYHPWNLQKMKVDLGWNGWPWKLKGKRKEEYSLGPTTATKSSSCSRLATLSPTPKSSKETLDSSFCIGALLEVRKSLKAPLRLSSILVWNNAWAAERSQSTTL